MSDPKEPLLSIIGSLVDGTISRDEIRVLNELLEGNKQNQLLYKRYLDLHCQLDWDLNAKSDEVLRGGTQEPQADYSSDHTLAARHRDRWITGGASIGIVATLLLIIFVFANHSDIKAAIGDFEGEVFVTRGGTTRQVARGMAIQAGDAIETRGENSFATLEYSDQSRFVLVSDSSATLEQSNVKNLLFQGGRLIASVEDTPSDAPFLINARHARLHATGSFVMESTANETRLNVLEGQVGVTSATANKSIGVSQGKYLVAKQGQPIALEDKTSNNDWREDFENGLPPGWQTGQGETHDLGTNSKGGVRAVKAELNGQVYYRLKSQEDWTRGLFIYRNDLHLNVTFKIEHSGWVNIFLIARTSNPKNHRTFLRKFTIDSVPSDVGVWRKVSVPLTEFQLKTENGFEDIPPTEGELFFEMAFSSLAPDPGLVIDDFAVQRGGPGKVVYEHVEQ